MTEDHQEYIATPPRATESAPTDSCRLCGGPLTRTNCCGNPQCAAPGKKDQDSISLSEFAKTPEAAANAATWENVPDHGNRDGSAKQGMKQAFEIAAALARDLEADFGPNQRSAAGDLARVMGLEGRVRDIAYRLWGLGRDTNPCDDYHRGYRFCCRSVSAELQGVLATPVPPPAGEPGMLTAEQGWQLWRELHARGISVLTGTTWQTSDTGKDECTFTLFDTADEDGEGIVGESQDEDPLRAFSQVYAAFVAAGKKGQQ